MKIKRPILVASLSGFFTLFLAFAFLKTKENSFSSREEAVSVLVAKQDIPRGVLLGEIDVETRSIPRRFLQPAVLVETKEAMTQMTIAPILQGEQITGTKLVPLGPASGLTLRIPAGQRALTIEVDEVSGVAGLIRPNNFVDLLATFEKESGSGRDQAETRTLAQRVLVLAVDQDFNLNPNLKSKPSPSKQGLFSKDMLSAPVQRKKTMTLALTPNQVQEVELAKRKGEVSLSLRPQEEEDTRELNPATIDSVRSSQRREYRGL